MSQSPGWPWKTELDWKRWDSPLQSASKSNERKHKSVNNWAVKARKRKQPCGSVQWNKLPANINPSAKVCLLSLQSSDTVRDVETAPKPGLGTSWRGYGPSAFRTLILRTWPWLTDTTTAISSESGISSLCPWSRQVPDKCSWREWVHVITQCWVQICQSSCGKDSSWWGIKFLQEGGHSLLQLLNCSSLHVTPCEARPRISSGTWSGDMGQVLLFLFHNLFPHPQFNFFLGCLFSYL